MPDGSSGGGDGSTTSTVRAADAGGEFKPSGKLPWWSGAPGPARQTQLLADSRRAAITTVNPTKDTKAAAKRGISSFAVLTYYGLANASAYTLTDTQRRWPKWLAGLGVGLCAVLAFTLPLIAVTGGLILLATGSVIWWASRRSRQ